MKKQKLITNKLPIVLAIDTSCDDTSVAVTQGWVVLANVIASQTELHQKYGGVFPTVAKLAHRENIQPTIKLALQRAKLGWPDIDLIAVTQGPGLAPALEVGILAAKQLAEKHHLPLVPVNHLEGHLLSPLAIRKGRGSNLNQQITPHLPALGMVVSGGHSQFVLVEKIGSYHVLGQTLDDAAGECLDKIGRMLNLGYPAGPVIEEFAKKGNAKAYQFPLPLTTTKDFNLSFSGLKTFAKNKLAELTDDGKKVLSQQQVYDFAASTQFGVFRHLTYKLTKILESYQVKEVWLGGGVAANIELRKMIRKTIKPLKLKVTYSKKLCMDNAAMIGIVAGNQLSTISHKPIAIDRQPQLTITSTAGK